MFGFFLKKAFFDGWDNLFTLVLLNLGFIALIAGLAFVPPLLAPLGGLPTLAAFLVFGLAAAAWYGVLVRALVKVADFGGLKRADLLPALRSGALPGLQLGLIGALLFLSLRVGLPFYFAQSGFLPNLAAGILLWVALLLLLSLQYYLPLRARLGGGLLKNLRKCLLLFLDNPLLSVLLLLYGAATMALSLFLAFLVPGGAGLALAQDDALRLLLKKYDWLEEHPEADRRRIPWGELLAEDKELVGKRTLRGMIFPWKE